MKFESFSNREETQLNKWSDKVKASQQKGILSLDGTLGYIYTHVPSEIFSITEEDLDTIGEINLEDKKKNLETIKEVEMYTGDKNLSAKFSPFLRTNNILNEVRRYKQEIGNPESWWALSNESKKEVLIKLGVQIPTGFENLSGKLMSTFGINKESDWLYSAFIHAATELSRRFVPYFELLSNNKNN